MIQRIILAAVATVALTAPAYAQKFEASFTGGYSTSEGISGDTIVTPAGSFNTIDVKSGGSFGLSFGRCDANRRRDWIHVGTADVEARRLRCVAVDRNR